MRFKQLNFKNICIAVFNRLKLRIIIIQVKFIFKKAEYVLLDFSDEFLL